MSLNGQYRINSRWVAHELMDDEVVIINLNSGNYYSLKDSGVEIWRSFTEGASVEAICASLADAYDVSRTEAERTVVELVAQLLAEHLVVEDRSRSARANGAVPSGESPGERRPFRSPVFEKYTDMQGLLFLDPIHDADETGWPRPRQA